MGMVVRTNTMAMNANRQLGVNNTQVSKSLEKLSSGFKINRAADDASGLAISEKMKAQIKGLEQASSNSQDGISLIQTAEGAATEIHDMLNRMVELATKSSNGTIQDEVDRDAIQREVDDLNSEISRIAQSTNFNGINLLDGHLSGGAGGSSAVTTIKTSLATNKVDATAGSYKSKTVTGGAKSGGTDAESKVSFTVGLDNGKSYTVELTVKKDDAGAGGTLVDSTGKSYGTVAAADAGASVAETAAAITAALKDTGLASGFKIEADTNTVKLTSLKTGTSAPKVTSFGENEGGTAKDQAVTTTAATNVTYKAAKVADYDGTNADAATFTINGKKFVTAATATDVSALGDDVTVLRGNVYDAGNMNIIKQQTGLTVTADAALGIVLGEGTTTAAASTGGLTLQVGDTNESFNRVTVSVDDLSATGIGTQGLDVSTQTSAGDSIQTIKDAINKVSTNRANLGSLQNRLEHTINNLDTTAENMSAANSRIRDTDMAKEMMNYTKMNVLVQSAQAMLAQANQQPQSILQLLQ